MANTISDAQKTDSKTAFSEETNRGGSKLKRGNASARPEIYSVNRFAPRGPKFTTAAYAPTFARGLLLR
jgi:hypothetical protein